jgi:hypothetical protein
VLSTNALRTTVPSDTDNDASKPSSSARDQCYRTRPLVNTPLKNPSEELAEIEIIDPMHPLFGRRFVLLSVSTSPRAIGYASVIYEGHMQLRIPLSATHLASRTTVLGTKLTLESVTELVALIQQCESLCPFLPTKSGADCPPPSKPSSSKT